LETAARGDPAFPPRVGAAINPHLSELKISDLRSPHTLPTALALKMWGARALAYPIILAEVKRFVGQPQTVSHRHIRSVPFDRAIPENTIKIIADEMALVCSGIL
jgi:hypothetical protein